MASEAIQNHAAHELFRHDAALVVPVFKSLGQDMQAILVWSAPYIWSGMISGGYR